MSLNEFCAIANKRRFPDRKSADVARIVTQGKDKGRALNVYACAECAGFHLTSKPESRQWQNDKRPRKKSRAERDAETLKQLEELRKMAAPEPPKKDHDPINNPRHYTQGIECIDYITSHGMSFCQGNVVKYVTRYKLKNGIEDLKKAKWYLQRLIDEELDAQSKRSREIPLPEHPNFPCTMAPIDAQPKIYRCEVHGIFGASVPACPDCKQIPPGDPARMKLRGFILE